MTNDTDETAMSELELWYRHQAKSEEDLEDLPACYTAPETIDNWRHTRMLALARPLLDAFPKAQWLTVGDGRFGCDAAFLIENGAAATASSLTEARLRYAAEKGYIQDYRVENAERLSLPEDSVDFVLCKESYHHFLRPPVAVYEMLRVARLGFVLIEPIENPRLLDSAKTLVKRLIRGDTEVRFEPTGNFLFRLNVRELCRMMTAVGGQVMAVKRFNDFYHPRLGSGRAESVNLAFLVTRLGIAVQDVLARSGLLGYGLASVVVFKGRPESAVLTVLKRQGYRVIDLPRNPYVTQTRGKEQG